MDKGQSKKNTGKIGHKTQKDRHGQHWAQDTERQTRATLDTRHRKINTCNSGTRHRKIKRVTLGTRHREIDTRIIGQTAKTNRHV